VRGYYEFDDDLDDYDSHYHYDDSYYHDLDDDYVPTEWRLLHRRHSVL
jgi:hypothetical protein